MGHSGVIQEQLESQNTFLSGHGRETIRLVLACIALFIAGLATTNSPLFETIQYETSHIRLLSSELNTAESTGAPIAVDTVMPTGKKKSGSGTSSTSSLFQKTNGLRKPSVTMTIRSGKQFQAKKIAEYRDPTR